MVAYRVSPTRLGTIIASQMEGSFFPAQNNPTEHYKSAFRQLQYKHKNRLDSNIVHEIVKSNTLIDTDNLN